MVSFRFHLVSLTAVFLALGVGIAMGATVVDRVTVDAVTSQLGKVEARSNRVAAQSNAVRAQLHQWEVWSADADDSLVRGQLTGVPVLLVVVRGTPVDDVRRVRDALVSARALLQGTVWLSARLRLDAADDVTRLAAVVGTTASDPSAVRGAAVTALSRRWLDPQGGNPLPALRDAGFVEYEAPPDGALDLAAIPTGTTRTVLLSSDRAEVPNEQLAIPLVEALAGTARVVVGDLSPLPGVDKPGAPFVTAVRQDPAVGSTISTVDDAVDFRGRTAIVLALADLGQARFGHYGFAAHAQRTMPATAPTTTP